ncbi:hypothetical protein [Halocatena marina]|uniref:hypothetical protein n=1 Tax=Halocatena marina TaxID=2934937 RepID=UPI00200C609A|nr:hypothetical protein [Halocatena marina]
MTRLIHADAESPLPWGRAMTADSTDEAEIETTEMNLINLRTIEASPEFPRDQGRGST